jgi:hypothetical protein
VIRYFVKILLKGNSIKSFKWSEVLLAELRTEKKKLKKKTIYFYHCERKFKE